MSRAIVIVNHSLQGKGTSGSVLQLDTSLPGTGLGVGFGFPTCQQAN